MRNSGTYLTFITLLPHYLSFTLLLLLALNPVQQLSNQNLLELLWVFMQTNRTEDLWKKSRQRERTETYSQTQRSCQQTEQTQRSKRAAEEGSLDKDRQKDRISLSHSRGRGSKLRLQREWDTVRDGGGKTRGSKGVTKNSRGVILDKHSVWCANIPNTYVIKI